MSRYVFQRIVRDYASALLLMGAMGAFGTAAIDASSPEQCQVESGTKICRDNIDGDAIEWAGWGFIASAGLAGINLAPAKNGTPSPQPINEMIRNRRESEDNEH
ncbi:hypothetical protein [Novosphingobium malaysiense]|uniref:hypothetical protein n=1 Tax=Novosphingobium malaysiense TaxID=1348853 RepID=UPI0018CD8ABF|nr:hypothetical protein [Novosphingobium malaysiense]